MKRALFLIAVATAACKPASDTPGAPPPTATATATTQPESSASVSGDMPIGNGAPVGERLSASVSPLTGSVTGFSVRVTDMATIVALNADVLFDFDKANLRPDATAALGKAADAIRAGGAGAIEIVGYTDAKGDDAYNLALSQRRAHAVLEWMKGQVGVRQRAFTVAGKGEADPVAANAHADGSDDPVGRAKNRRVEIVIPKA